MILQDFYLGQAFDAYEYFGVHMEEKGTVFRTYAPNAEKVAVVGDFNEWHESNLEQMYRSGVWSVVLPDVKQGQLYKYVIYGKNGRVEHCDPYGFTMELRPGACSIVWNLSGYQFSDCVWMKKRTRCYDKPLNIYELDLGSWKMKNGKSYQYDEIADELISYVKSYGYNYVEFLPLSEHPFDGSWGYQNTGFFAPTSRYGTPYQLMELINRLHMAGIGAIMDFVPVHFAVDSYGLKEYDGTPFYEYPHKDVGESEWGSYNFNHSRPEVASFLQSAANFWLQIYHFDGLRMDAVSRLLYWQGDENRGENGTSVNFLKIMNQGLHRRHPEAMLIAEDSSTYPGVTKSVDEGGLGFDYKWDLGWMHDTLEYLKCHSFDRKWMRDRITFSIFYTYNERYLLPFSHDEVVHGKKTIIDKINGTYTDKFAQAKVLYLYMMTHPGKKLNFMGNEIAMFREWDETREPDWDLLTLPAHNSFHKYMQELNALYIKSNACWEMDSSCDGFEWVNCQTENPCVFAYLRKGKTKRQLVILNFSDERTEINLTIEGNVRMVLNTEWTEFGGVMQSVKKRSISKTLPPYSGVVYSCSL